MLSRTADHLFWMARYTERAGLVAAATSGEATTQPRAAARAVFSACWSPRDAVKNR